MTPASLISSARYELDANPNRAWQPEDVAQLLEAAEHVQGEHESFALALEEADAARVELLNTIGELRQEVQKLWSLIPRPELRVVPT